MVEAIGNTSKEVAASILVARDRAVLLDSDLADLYGVSTKALNQAVKRNAARFPSDFAFRLTQSETHELNRLVGSRGAQKNRDPKSPPFAFTEHGAMMLAMVLRSPRAVEMSVLIVRAFVSLRDAARWNSELVEKLQELEARMGRHDADIAAILRAVNRLMTTPRGGSRGIGFLADIS